MQCLKKNINRFLCRYHWNKWKNGVSSCLSHRPNRRFFFAIVSTTTLLREAVEIIFYFYDLKKRADTLTNKLILFQYSNIVDAFYWTQSTEWTIQTTKIRYNDNLAQCRWLNVSAGKINSLCFNNIFRAQYKCNHLKFWNFLRAFFKSFVFIIWLIHSLFHWFPLSLFDF